jgi:hypothetical protein
LMLSLPAGTSTIELVFAPDVWDALGATITGLVFAGLGGLAWRRRRGAQGRSQAEVARNLDLSRWARSWLS